MLINDGIVKNGWFASCVIVCNFLFRVYKTSASNSYTQAQLPY